MKKLKSFRSKSKLSLNTTNGHAGVDTEYSNTKIRNYNEGNGNNAKVYNPHYGAVVGGCAVENG